MTFDSQIVERHFKLTREQLHAQLDARNRRISELAQRNEDMGDQKKEEIQGKQKKDTEKPEEKFSLRELTPKVEGNRQGATENTHSGGYFGVTNSERICENWLAKDKICKRKMEGKISWMRLF